MATEHVLPFSVVSVVEEILQQHGTKTSGTRSRQIDLASRKADEACTFKIIFIFIPCHLSLCFFSFLFLILICFSFIDSILMAFKFVVFEY